MPTSRSADDASSRLAAPFADPRSAAPAATCVYVDPDGGQPVTAQAGSLYWRLEEHIKALESATGSVMGADGSIFAMRSRCTGRRRPI